MPHIEAARSRGAKSLSSKTLDELYTWRVREYELGCDLLSNQLPKKNPETQQNLCKKNLTYIPKSLPFAIHKIFILNEPVVVHGKIYPDFKKIVSLLPRFLMTSIFIFSSYGS